MIPVDNKEIKNNHLLNGQVQESAQRIKEASGDHKEIVSVSPRASPLVKSGVSKPSDGFKRSAKLTGITDK